MEDHNYYSSNSNNSDNSAKRSKLDNLNDEQESSSEETMKPDEEMTENSAIVETNETVIETPITDVNVNEVEISDDVEDDNTDDAGISSTSDQTAETPLADDETDDLNDEISRINPSGTSDDEDSQVALLYPVPRGSRTPDSNTGTILLPDLIDLEPSTSGARERDIRNSFAAAISHMKRNYRSRRMSHVSSSSSDSIASRVPETRRPIVTHDSDSSSNPFSDINSNDSFDSFDSSTASTINFPNETTDSDDSIPEADLNSANEILAKEKPKHTLNLAYEIMYRENGLSGHGRGQNKRRDPLVFPNRVYSSLHIVEKLKLMHSLQKHRGCVNSLNFHRNGQLLCTGSDDLKIVIWNWAANKMTHSFHSGHHANVFQTKFVDLSSSSLNIVSSSRDGQIRLATVPPSGGRKVVSKFLFKHAGAVHRIAICPDQPNEVLTAGEDGQVASIDLRSSNPYQRIVCVKINGRRVPLYSIAHHPLDPEFCLCGRDQFIRIYDKRNCKNPVQRLAPDHMHENRKPSVTHITCAVYNQSGSEILASYSDEDIYLYNSKNIQPGNYIHRYKGYCNHKTIKGVNFFGPNSEYIISGSDCGNIFFWEKETETIVNWMKGDSAGVVNCLEPHPSFPVLATCGLDYDAKIWAPVSDADFPKLSGLEKCVRNNIKRSTMYGNELFDDRTFFFFVRQCMRNRAARADTETTTTNHNGESSSDERDFYPDTEGDDEDDDDDGRGGNMPCATQ